MHRTVYTVVLFTLFRLTGQAQCILLDTVYKLNNYTAEFTYRSVQLSEDKFVLIGYAANTKYWINLFCINKHGDTLWNVQYNIDSLGSPTVNQSTIDRGKNILLGCTLYNTNIHGTEAMLIKTDSSGNLKWVRHYPIYIPYTSQYISLYGEVPMITADNNYLLTCDYANDTGVVNFLAIKVDSNGNEITRWNYPTPYYDFTRCSIQTSDSGFLFAGESNRLFGLRHFFFSQYILKTDQYGNKQWDTSYPSLFTDSLLIGEAEVRDVLEVDDGYVLAGTKAYASNYDYNQGGPRGWEKCWIGKISKTDGHMLWEHYYGIDTADLSVFLGVVSSDDGGYVLCGGWNFAGNTKGRAWVMKTDSMGNEIWSTIITHPLDSIHYTDQMELHKIHKINGGFLITGFRWPDWPIHQQPFPYVITIDNSGCWELGCSVTDVKEVVTNQVNASLLVYPNPFVSDISISLQRENLKEANFTITNLMGQVIYRKEETNLANSYTKMLDLCWLPDGVYLLEITIDGERMVRRIVKQ